MEADDRRAGLGEVGHDAVDRLHHQVHVDRHRRVRPDRLADQRPDRQVRNVVVVHHVEVDEVGAGGDRPRAPPRPGARSRRTGATGRSGSRASRYNPRQAFRGPPPMAESKKYEITVAPEATYVADQSDPSRNQYVFAYTITVTNTGTVPAQLLSRHWIITDSDHHVQEVKGLGVVGQQPLLKPGESFEYTSGASTADRRSARCAARTRWSPRTGTRSRPRSRCSRCRCRACCIERRAQRGAPRSVAAGACRVFGPIVHHTMPTASSSARALRGRSIPSSVVPVRIARASRVA